MNAAFGHSDVHSTVKGIDIHLTESFLGQILRVPTKGVLNEFPEEKGHRLSFLLNKDVSEDFEKIDARDLDVEKRLLHHIVSRIILPRNGRYDLLTNRDVTVMCDILKNHPVNFPELIITVMKEALSKKKAPLPYGLILSHIFKFCGVRVRGEVSKDLKHTDVYNEHSLHRMGFNKVNNEWIRIRGGRPLGQLGEEEEEEEEEAAPVEGEDMSPLNIPAPPAPATESSRRSPARQRIVFDEGAPSGSAPSAPPAPPAGISRLHPDDIQAIAREISRLSAPAPSPAPTSVSTSTAVEPHYSYIAQTLASIQEELRSVSFDTHRLTGRYLDIEQRLLGVERAVSSLVSDPSDLESARRQLKTGPSISDISTEITCLRGMLDVATTAMGRMSSDMDRGFVILHSSLHSTQKTVDSLSTRVNDISSMLSPISSEPPAQPTFSPVHPSTAGPFSRTRATGSKRKDHPPASHPVDVDDSSESD